MSCPLCDVIERAGRGDHPLFVAALQESVVVLGDNQGCPGWCVLLLKEHCEHMAELPIARQARLFEDVARVAEAIRSVVGPVRINYECLGNQVAHVHWHVIPRHAGDPTPRLPVWGWTAEQLRGEMPEAARVEMCAKIRGALGA